MHKALTTLALPLLVTLSLGCKTTHHAASGPEDTAVMAPVHQFIDGFNKGDTKSAVAACTDQMSIIDDFPPHEWHGSGALTKWMSDFEADAAIKEDTDEIVSLGEPRHIDVTKDRAYVVVPAKYHYKEKGKPIPEKGAIMTLALQKGAAGWKITGWCWAQD